MPAQSKFSVIVGEKFGRLTVLEDNNRQATVLCRCDCGTEKIVSVANIKQGKYVSCGCKSSYRPLDIGGLRSGWLTALEPTNERQDHNVMWRCVCDCGNECLVSATSVARQQKKSCGCQTSTMMSDGVSARRSKVQLPMKDAAIKKVLGTYMKDAKKRKIAFALSIDEFTDLLGGRCFYCGRSPANVQKVSRAIDGGVFLYNGIDRINSARWYETTNCVSCCRVCNRAKNSMPYAEFIAWLRDIASNFSDAVFSTVKTNQPDDDDKEPSSS